MDKYTRRVICLCVIMVLSLCMLSCSNGRPDTQHDKDEYKLISSSLLSVDNKELNFGEINKSDKTIIPFTFTLRNDANSTIVIEKIDVSCGCVKIIGSPKTLESGQSGNLTGEIDLTNQSGHIRKSIFINYCDSCLTVVKVVADILD